MHFGSIEHFTGDQKIMTFRPVNRILLFPSRTAWMAHYTGPYAETVMRAAGSPILPTAWTADADASTVREDFARRWPDFHVVILHRRATA